MSEDKIRCTRLTKKILIAKKQVTGKSIPALVEFAVMNMDFIPLKKLNKNVKKK